METTCTPIEALTIARRWLLGNDAPKPWYDEETALMAFRRLEDLVDAHRASEIEKGLF